uniref:Uncharacterized protein n=1 Tax=Arundo donax TaxID=35708 RepID=A0A0A8XQH7_ARUDO
MEDERSELLKLPQLS